MNKVDVLAYLDAQIASHQALSADAYHQQELPKVQAVRDAVAHLADAASRHIHAVDYPANDGDDLKRQDRTLRALSAALAGASS